MFGFLYAPAPSCGTSARSLYQSIFCGLSCQLHTDYHAAARFLVNRDATFLALAGTALADTDTAMQQRTCCNPLAKHKPICCDETSLGYAAAVTVSGLATKLQDNKEDERGWRKHLPRLVNNIITPACDKATAVLNSCHFPTFQTIQTLQTQSEIEKGAAGFMEASNPTSQAYGNIFSHLAKINKKPHTSQSLFLLGSSLGRLIYWKDATDDWASDQRHGRFNPLQYQSASELPELVDKEFQQLRSTARAIPWLRHGELIQSIIDHTTHYHQVSMSIPGGAKKKKKRTSKDSWCDSCHCCPCDDCSLCSCSPCD